MEARDLGEELKTLRARLEEETAAFESHRLRLQVIGGVCVCMWRQVIGGVCVCMWRQVIGGVCVCMWRQVIGGVCLCMRRQVIGGVCVEVCED